MSFREKLQQIDQLQETIVQHGRLDEDVLKKINYKFRLEWNYTSNSMEGNSLSRSETRSVMIGNITVNNKPIQDILEMKGHDEVVTEILKIGKSELNISESKIKQIHKAIMHEENPEKQALTGKWKTSNNYLINYKGERFDFVEHAEVPERMHQLINWLNTEKEKIKSGKANAVHPVELALKFHLDYIAIHPFHDGNGRSCRIFTNLILISYGYPPIYIAENERKAYYQYLADVQGYGGNPDIFYEFMSGLVMRSQQIILDAASGKDID
jgi:Fic family protein